MFEFTAQLAFETSEIQMTGVTASGGFPLCPRVEGVEVSCGPSGASFTTESYHVSVSVNYVHDQPQLVWLVVPGKASWLKEFFSVQMMVSNLADPDFMLDHGSATLAIPEGLTLAPTAAGQSATARMEDIPGGQSATATWILRGDTEGFYDLTASYAGSLEPFGDTVTVHAATDKQLHVWGGSALQLTVDADDSASARYPYHVIVGLKNVADVPVYNPTIELLKEGKQNYIYQPREQLQLSAAELAPGDTLSRDWILVPTISGTLDLGRSFVSKTAGDVEPPSKITSHPADTPPAQAPEIQVYPMKNKVALAWEPVEDATGYQVYSTPDPETDFPAEPAVGFEPLSRGADGRERAVVRVPAGTTAWYAVSPTVKGRPSMRHPLIQATSASTDPSPRVDATYSWPSESSHTCGVETGTIHFTFTEPFFDLTEYEITVGETTYSRADLSGKTVKVDREIDLTSDPLRVQARAKNSDSRDDWGPTWEQTFDTKCLRDSAVLLAAGLNSSLDAGGSTTPLSQCLDRQDGEAFNRTFATNDCDSNDPKGNLVAYLMDKGYDPGEDRSSPNRTLLEFSYGGAVVSCTSAGPTFVPQPYIAQDTWDEIKGELSHYGTSTAAYFVDRLQEYSRCWKQRHGRELAFTVIGHSEGGYEALAMASEAASKGYDYLISSVVSIDGAIHPHVVLGETDLADCFTFVNQIKLPGEVEAALYRAALDAEAEAQRAVTLIDIGEENATKNRIKDVQNAGTKVVTITNYYDGCLSINTTLSNATQQKILWVDHGRTGGEQHAAVLKAHDERTTDPGYPLTSFLDTDWHQYVVPGGSVLLKPKPTTLAAARSAMVAAAGRLIGRVVDPATGTPISTGGQVVVVGPTGSRYTNVQADGTFAFEGLNTGDYRLFINAFTEASRGAWVGGSTLETATAFRVDEATTDAGDVSGGRTSTLKVGLVDAGGNPVPGAVAVLVDAEGRTAAKAKADAAGTAELAAPPGAYTVGAASTSTKAASVAVNSTTTGDVTLRLEPAAVVTATVKDENGAPLPGVVAALYSGDNVVAAGFTGQEGTYTFSGQDPGDYTVRLYEGLQRFELPPVALPVTAVVGDPAAGQVSYTLGETPAITSQAPPKDTTVGEPYSFTFAASGSPPPSFSLANGQLPDGLGLGPSGVLSGTPTKAGTYTFSVTASNPAGTAVGGPYTITVEAKPSITSGAPPAGSAGSPYSFTFTASGAPAPTFAVASGALPDGLTLDQDGRLHGTPTKQGRYSFSVAAHNRAGTATAGPYTVVISVPPAVDRVVSLDQKLPAAQLVSPAMPVSAGELVLAHVSADGPPKPRQEVTAVTGGGLAWSLAVRSNTGDGTAEIWQAYSTQAIGQLRVTAKLARTGYDGSITVTSFKGARPVVGATATAAGSKVAPTVALTPNQDGSLVWAAGHDATRAQVPIPLSGQSIVHQFLDTRAKDTFWTQRLNNPASKGATVRMGASAPTGDQWQFVAVEVIPVAP